MTVQRWYCFLKKFNFLIESGHRGKKVTNSKWKLSRFTSVFYTKQKSHIDSIRAMFLRMCGNLSPYTRGFRSGGMTTNSSDRMVATNGFRSLPLWRLRATSQKAVMV